MRVIVERGNDAMSKRAAVFVANLVRRKPDCVLGLATGGTPVGMYQELVRMHKEEDLCFSEVTTFNLDEYYPIKANDKNSYHKFMSENLFDHLVCLLGF